MDPNLWPNVKIEMAVVHLKDRDHNKYARESLKEAVVNHFDKNIAKHFRSGNRFRYDHAQRSFWYIRAKRRVTGQQVDLVKSGTTRKYVPRVRRVRVSGSATTAGSRGFSATVESWFPFPGGKTGRRRNGGRAVTVEQMADEIATWGPGELGIAVQDFLDRYVQRVKHHFASRRRQPWRVTT